LIIAASHQIPKSILVRTYELVDTVEFEDKAYGMVWAEAEADGLEWSDKMKATEAIDNGENN